MSPQVPPDSIPVDIATLKAEVSTLRGTTDKLGEALEKLSESIKDLSVSLEGAKTRLNIAIGVAVFVATMTVPLLVKSFSSSPAPVAASALSEIRDLERQIETDEYQRQIKELRDELKDYFKSR
jgi:prefoldin subunit 5